MTDPIHAWLELEWTILQAKRPVEAAFAAVDRAHTLVPYRQAALLAELGHATVEGGSP